MHVRGLHIVLCVVLCLLHIHACIHMLVVPEDIYSSGDLIILCEHKQRKCEEDEEEEEGYLSAGC